MVQEKVNIRAIRLGELLRECRLGAGLTQEQLASRLATHRTVISKIESGDVQPAYELVKRWGIATNSRDVIGLEFSGTEDWRKVRGMKATLEQIKSLANSVSFLKRRRM